jgi:sugar lactone lactonase YvrE
MTVRTISGDALRCVLPWRATVGESPVWSSAEQKLYWIDIQGKRVHAFDPCSGTNATFELPEIVTSVALRATGGLVLTLEKDFALFDPDTQSLSRVGTVEADVPNNRFNDGKCDPQGRFFAGTMDAKNWSAPAGHLFRMDANHSVTTVQSDVICSNGCGWSPDGRTMYYIESFRYAIYAYDFDLESGALYNRRSFVAIDRAEGGFPDGMTVDSGGCVWCNVVGLGQVRRYDSQGKLERVLQLPVPRATDCTFGGREMKTLFITSARETMTPEQLAVAPLSGSLFAYDFDVPGVPASRFAG